MTAASILFALSSTALVFSLPRRTAAVPLLLTGCFMTLGERMVILGLDFTIFRILVLAGWLRVLIRREAVFLKPHPMDRIMLVWAAVCIIFGVCLYQSFGGFTYNLGQSYNAVGLYFLFRIWIQDFEGLRNILKHMAVMTAVLAGLIMIEWATGRNLFSIFGGVPEFTQIRDDRLRCQGPFGHPILAGTFGATLMPLMLSLFWQPREFRRFAWLGIAGATVIPTSSAPDPTYVAMSFGRR